jgi:hypothetical protein
MAVNPGSSSSCQCNWATSAWQGISCGQKRSICQLVPYSSGMIMNVWHFQFWPVYMRGEAGASIARHQYRSPRRRASAGVMMVARVGPFRAGRGQSLAAMRTETQTTTRLLQLQIWRQALNSRQRYIKNVSWQTLKWFKHRNRVGCPPVASGPVSEINNSIGPKWIGSTHLYNWEPIQRQFLKLCVLWE